MARFTRKAILIDEFGLSSQDFFDSTKDGHVITIVRRAGMEKIAEEIQAEFFGLQVSGVDTRIGPIFTATISARRKMQNNAGDYAWSDIVNTCASASPQNTVYNRYSEIAENRVKHRAILALAGLSLLNVHSIDEADDFMNMSKENFKKSSGKKSEAKDREIKVTTQAEKMKEIENVMDQMTDTGNVKGALKKKQEMIKKNKDLLK
jgi:hypothetical protein